jgi:hypothetical protein
MKVKHESFNNNLVIAHGVTLSNRIAWSTLHLKSLREVEEFSSIP